MPTKLQLIEQEARKYELPAGFAIVGREDGTAWTAIELHRNGTAVVTTVAFVKRQIAGSVESLAEDAAQLAARSRVSPHEHT